MSEESQELQPTKEEINAVGAEKIVATGASMDELPPWAQEEIRSLRREAGGRRKANNELSTELEEYRKWKDDQKTELEKTVERALKAEAEAKEMKREKLQREVAEEVGLDPKLASRIRGNSEDEMLEDAKELAETAGKRKGSDAFVGSGGGGNAVRQPDTTNIQFGKWLNSQ